MQDYVWRLKQEPRQEDRLEIARLWSILCAKVEDHLQRHAIVEFQRITLYDNDDSDIFDHIDEENTITDELPSLYLADGIGTVPIELHPLPIRSTALSVDHPLRSFELGLRISQAS